MKSPSMKLHASQSGSLLIEVLIGMAIASFVVLTPMQMYFTSYSKLKKFDQIENALQLGRQIMGEYRGILPTDSELDAGVHYRTYDADGVYIGGQKSTLKAVDQARVYYETQTTVGDSSQHVAMGPSFATDLNVKQMNLKVTWLYNENDPSKTTDDEYKSIQLSSMITGY
jgi:hypothetical protein